MWQTLGEPKSDGGVLPAYGCYQTKFLGFVQDVLTLCLSHHDHLRTTAVEILCVSFRPLIPALRLASGRLTGPVYPSDDDPVCMGVEGEL